MHDLKTADPSLRAQALALNNLHARELSLLSAERLDQLVERAFAAAHIGRLDAMLIAFDQDAEYDSPNFVWFRSRLERFVYIDRIVVDEAARGRGLARRLYACLTRQAVDAGHVWLTCEVNSIPPNPGSDAFHAALGFETLGEARLAGPGKTVRYLGLRLPC